MNDIIEAIGSEVYNENLKTNYNAASVDMKIIEEENLANIDAALIEAEIIEEENLANIDMSNDFIQEFAA